MTVPPSSTSPYRLRADDDGRPSTATARKVASVSVGRAGPGLYDLQTADGVPYHHIAPLHLARWPRRSCRPATTGGTPISAGSVGSVSRSPPGGTVAKKSAGDARRGRGGGEGARRGRGRHPDHGDRRSRLTGSPLRRPVRAGGEGGRPGCRSRCSSSRPVTSRRSSRCATWGSTSSGVHVESSIPRCSPAWRLASPIGIDTYFRTWERVVALFGEGRVSTYVILGMGEDPDLTVQARNAPSTSVYPVRGAVAPGSGLAHGARPGAVAGIHRSRLPQGRGVPRRARAGRDTAVAGCARARRARR